MTADSGCERDLRQGIRVLVETARCRGEDPGPAVTAAFRDAMAGRVPEDDGFDPDAGDETPPAGLMPRIAAVVLQGLPVDVEDLFIQERIIGIIARILAEELAGGDAP